jgi:hypothetical protein
MTRPDLEAWFAQFEVPVDDELRCSIPIENSPQPGYGDRAPRGSIERTQRERWTLALQQSSGCPTGWSPVEGLSPICGEGDDFGRSIRGPEHREPAWSFADPRDPGTTLATNLHRGHVWTTEEDDRLRPGLGLPRVMLAKMQTLSVLAVKPVTIQ